MNVFVLFCSLYSTVPPISPTTLTLDRCTRIRRPHHCWRSPGLVLSFCHIHSWLWNEILDLHKSPGMHIYYFVICLWIYGDGGMFMPASLVSDCFVSFDLWVYVLLSILGFWIMLRLHHMSREPIIRSLFQTIKHLRNWVSIN